VSAIDPVRAERIRQAAGASSDRIIAIRREIHRFPELGLSNPRTQRTIVDRLRDMGVDSIRTGDDACSWVIADIVGRAAGDSGGCVALRADTDALPIDEPPRVDWASKLAGCMHACGHDGHVAMLIGAAAIVCSQRDSFAGTVRCLFQPGEEGFGGAPKLIEAGALDGVKAAFAIHLQPGAAPSTVDWRPGTIMAAFDDFTVRFRGQGGHASSPHATRDPIPAIGPLVDGLSHVAARETPPDDRVVFSVTQVIAGAKENVIPPFAECRGTIRSLSERGRSRAREQLGRVATGVAHMRGLDLEIDVRDGYPPTINDDGVVRSVAAVASDLEMPVRRMPSPFMGAEDFAYYLQHVPGALVFLGCHTDGSGPLHSPEMKLDEAVLARGAALHAGVALALLASP